MKMRIVIGRLCALLFALITSVEVHAMMEADKFIGAWRLVSTEYHADDGTPAESAYGPEPQGLLIYDAHGSMSAQFAQKGRTPFAIYDRMAGTPDEMKAA